jgi:peptidyl-prolyl cis-trans isomerase SurA
MNRNHASIVRILAVTLMLVAGLLLAAALPAQGQTRGTQTANLAPAATNGNAVQAGARPVARVNGAVLTDVDLLREMYAIFPYAKQHNGTFPRAMEADIRRGALKMIEFEELVYQEAKRRQMTIAPERLAKAEKQFRDHFPSEQEYQQFLKLETNGSLPALRTKIARSLLIEDFIRVEVTDKAKISIAEARAFYLKNPERFKLDESYALQTITIMPPVRPTPKQPVPPQPTLAQSLQMKARAEDALRQAKAAKTYEEFGVLAEKISEDDYRVMMGNHKAVNAKDLPPAILQAASKMQVGQVSDLVQAEGAFTIIRLNAHTPARVEKFSEVESTLRAKMTQQNTERLRRELDARLRKNAKIEEL